MDNPRLKKLLKFYESGQADAFIIFALAKEYENQEAWDKALEYYNTLKSRFPDYVGLYYHLAKLKELLGAPEEALDIYSEGIAVAKSAGDTHALSELNNAKLNLELEEGL